MKPEQIRQRLEQLARVVELEIVIAGCHDLSLASSRPRPCDVPNAQLVDGPAGLWTSRPKFVGDGWLLAQRAGPPAPAAAVERRRGLVVAVGQFGLGLGELAASGREHPEHRRGPFERDREVAGERAGRGSRRPASRSRPRRPAGSVRRRPRRRRPSAHRAPTAGRPRHRPCDTSSATGRASTASWPGSPARRRATAPAACRGRRCRPAATNELDVRRRVVTVARPASSTAAAVVAASSLGTGCACPPAASISAVRSAYGAGRRGRG